MEYTFNDIKTLKYEKRFGFVMSFFILCFGGIFNLYYSVIEKSINYFYISIIDVAIIGLSILVYYLINRKLIKDLKKGKKIIKTEIVLKKLEEISYEAGSGALFIPILGNLFPKLWGQEMKSNKKYYFFINNYKYDVDQSIYNRVKKGENVEMHFSQYNDTFLGFETIKSKEL